MWEERLGKEKEEKKNTHEWLNWKTEHDPAMCACRPKSQPYLGMQQKAVASRSREVNPCFCSGEDTSGTPWPALDSSAQENYGPLEWVHRRAGTPIPWGKAEKVAVIHSGEKESLRRPYRDLPVPKGGLLKRWKIIFSRACCDRSIIKGFKQKERRFRLDRRTFLQ